MEMNNTTGQTTRSIENVDSQSKSLTPAVLGVANSHGVKFPANMTSEYKKELFSKLEEWRKARKEKLAARILAKQKQISMPPAPLKNKQSPKGDNGNVKRLSDSKHRVSVFERLYNSSNNNNRKKKLEVPVTCTKVQPISRANISASALLAPESTVKPVKVLHIDKDNKNLPVVSDSDATNKMDREIVTENFQNDSVCNNIKAVEERDEILSYSTLKTKSNEEISKKCRDHEKKADIKTYKIESGLLVTPKKGEVHHHKKTLRRSISMMFRQKHRSENAVRRCISAKNLHEVNLNAQTADFKNLTKHNFNKENPRKDKGILKPMAFNTPRTTKSIAPVHLRTKLENWLKMHGHSVEGYRHLRCFGITKNGNISPGASKISLDGLFEKSYESIQNAPVVDHEKENAIAPFVIQSVDVNDANNWLKELHRLIVELKYPSERCEEWLSAIKNKCPDCTMLPIYWECLAGLQESKGDLKSAVEDYERVEIEGDKVDIGDSLAKLLDKMVLEQKKLSKTKFEKGLDPKNIFKSTVIKFALQQKPIKKLTSEIEPGAREQLYVATPVRRSSRIQTPLKSAEEFASLQGFTPEFRKNITFQPNQSLLE